MNRPDLPRFVVQSALSALLACLALCQPLLAQAAEEKEEPSRSWVNGYMLVVLCVSLGLFVVVRMGKRKVKKIKRKDDENWD